jgi:hypothetical protein
LGMRVWQGSVASSTPKHETSDRGEEAKTAILQTSLSYPSASRHNLEGCKDSKLCPDRHARSRLSVNGSRPRALRGVTSRKSPLDLLCRSDPPSLEPCLIEDSLGSMTRREPCVNPGFCPSQSFSIASHEICLMYPWDAPAHKASL